MGKSRCRKKGRRGLPESTWAPSTAWEGFSGCDVCAHAFVSAVLEQWVTAEQGSDCWFPKQPERQMVPKNPVKRWKL